jgi:quaternary ammonium compound-resistance protein SugE
MTAWLALFLAGCFEVIWAVGLKYSDGFSRFWPSMGTAVAILLSFGCLSLALQSMPFGTAYVVWCGIGAAGTTIAGIALFDEPAHFFRLGCLLLIVTGVFGLKLAGSN